MKHHTFGRPIGKCKGCCLNLRTICAAGLDPKSEWDRGRCRFRNQRDLLDRFYNPVLPMGAKAAKTQRRARAVAAETAPHYDGQVFAPARTGGSVGLRP
jgi:hypothetical protein